MPLRKIEVFTAECSLCDDAVQLVQRLACESCEVEVLDMKTAAAQSKAKQYSVTRSTCHLRQRETGGLLPSGPVDEATLCALGIGSPA